MLRKIITLLCLTLCIMTYAQERVNFQTDGPGVISLRVTAYGKKAKDATANAEMAAVKSILFRDVPGSNQVETPLAGTDEDAIMTQHKDYFNELFGNGRYRSFILSNVLVTGFAKDATKKKCLTADIKVNLNALRSDLETHQVIRKFGF